MKWPWELLEEARQKRIAIRKTEGEGNLGNKGKGLQGLADRLAEAKRKAEEAKKNK